MYNIIELKAKASWRWLEIANASGMGIKGTKTKHESCPICPDDWPRFRMDDKQGQGSWICNHCGAGDGLELVKLHLGGFREAIDFVAGYLGMAEESDIDWDEINRRKAEQEKVNNARLAHEAKLKLCDQQYAAQGAALIVSESVPSMQNHVYLLAKHIKGQTALIMQYQFFIPAKKRSIDICGSLVIPMINERRELVNCQIIKPNGFKMFLMNGQIIGAFHFIGRIKNGDTILIGEGFATMDTLHDATGYTCVVAFNAGNLDPVVEIIKALHPDSKLIIMGDNDHHNEFTKAGNAGLTKAIECSIKYDIDYHVPPMLKGVSDYNDLDVIHGRKALIDELVKCNVLTVKSV